MLELTIPEREIAIEVLSSRLVELMIEINHTGSFEYKEALRKRRRNLESLLEKIRMATPVAEAHPVQAVGTAAARDAHLPVDVA